MFRRSFALLSACGLAVSVVAYGESFSGSQAELIFRCLVVLLPGWIALFFPIYILEYHALRTRRFGFKSLARGMPSWVAPSARLLWLVAMVHLAWGMLRTGWGVPAIQDGQYVLEAHGRILRLLTPAEYFSLRAALARMSAAMMIFFYFMPTMYWWFRRNEGAPHFPPVS